MTRRASMTDDRGGEQSHEREGDDGDDRAGLRRKQCELDIYQEIERDQGAENRREITRPAIEQEGRENDCRHEDEQRIAGDAFRDQAYQQADRDQERGHGVAQRRRPETERAGFFQQPLDLPRAGFDVLFRSGIQGDPSAHGWSCSLFRPGCGIPCMLRRCGPRVIDPGQKTVATGRRPAASGRLQLFLLPASCPERRRLTRPGTLPADRARAPGLAVGRFVEPVQHGDTGSR